MLAEQPDAVEQQVAEIGGVEHLEAVLIGGIELLALAAGEARGLARGHLLGQEAAVLPIVDHVGEHARGPALLVDVLGGELLFEEPQLIVRIQDGEIGLEPDQLRVPAQDLRAYGMEGAEPGHALHHLSDHGPDAKLHLAGGLVGEGDGQDIAGACAAGREDVGDARGEDARFPGPRAGQHQHRPFERFDREALLRIEVGQIRRPRGRAGARSNPAGFRQVVVVAGDVGRLGHSRSVRAALLARGRVVANLTLKMALRADDGESRCCGLP